MPRHRCERPAGRRRLVRAPVRQAARPHTRVRAGRSATRSPARSRSSTTGEHYPLPFRGDGALGLGKPLKMITHPRRADVPDLPRRRGPEERRARDGDRRRLGAALLLAVPTRGVRDADDGGEAGLRGRGERVRERRRRRRHRALAGEGDARLLHRRHGGEVEELPHRADGPDGLRGAGASGSRTCSSTASATRRSRPSPTRSPTRSRSSARRSASPNDSTPGVTRPVTTILLGGPGRHDHPRDGRARPG